MAKFFHKTLKFHTRPRFDLKNSFGQKMIDLDPDNNIFDNNLGNLGRKLTKVRGLSFAQINNWYVWPLQSAILD